MNYFRLISKTVSFWFIRKTIKLRLLFYFNKLFTKRGNNRLTLYANRLVLESAIKRNNVTIIIIYDIDSYEVIWISCSSKKLSEHILSMLLSHSKGFMGYAYLKSIWN